MPFPARLVALCILPALGAACGYDAGSDLRPAVERVTPPGARVVGACGGSSGLIDEPSYSCTYLIRGEGGELADEIATALRKDGFAVSCSRPGEVAALRRNVRVTAELTPGGWTSTRGGVVNVYPPGYRPEGSRAVPKGSIAVNLSASRQAEASADFWRHYVAEGGRCDRPLVLPHPLELCVTWWNGEVGMKTSETAARRRLGPQVRIVRSELPGVSACTYTLRAANGFTATTGRFDHGRWIWSPLRAVARPSRFVPNARLGPNGVLALRLAST